MVSIVQIVTVPESAATRTGHNPHTDTTRAKYGHNPRQLAHRPHNPRPRTGHAYPRTATIDAHGHTGHNGEH